MDNFWLQKAHKYIHEHRAFTNVGDIIVSEDDSFATISADLNVGLPARFADVGITNLGVRSIEPVIFIFEDEFPLKAPKIILRKDFPRSFPHIHPNKEEVLPCIFEGSLSELMQQSEWMNGILNQLVDWMEKAASGSLLDYTQGWEPMRIDESAGYIVYDIYELFDFLEKAPVGTRKIHYDVFKGKIFAGLSITLKKMKYATIIVCRHPAKCINNLYIPNTILTLNDLYGYATSLGICGLKDIVERNDRQNIKEEKIFIALAVHRPCNVIGTDRDVEILNFVINKSKPRKKEKKRVLPNCKVKMLAHINTTSPQLLKRMSGAKQTEDETFTIALLGCGSLGSKIGLHLARNGNGPFLCIDHDTFMPHNNARHGLSITCTANKAEQLSWAISSITGRDPTQFLGPAGRADFSGSRILIDTTASLAVRAFLMSNQSLPPIISHGIYGGGKLGVSLIEGDYKNPRLDDLWASLYRLCLDCDWLQNILFSEQKENVSIGQGCGSHTIIMDDATLSLFASAMGMIDQRVMEGALPQNGKIILTRIQDDINLLSEKIDIPVGVDVPSLTDKDWNVRILESVIEKMQRQSLAAGRDETGGCLMGSVFLAPKSIVVTDILPPPPDSTSTPTLFVLGVEGLKKQIKNIERRTNGKVTYLGTWHSHPHGGSASETDKKTASRLLFVRNYEPTVCLIWTPGGVIQI
jgi:hypothetical protein